MRTHFQAEKVQLITMADVDLHGRKGRVELPKYTSYRGVRRQLAVRLARRCLRWAPIEYTLSVCASKNAEDDAREPVDEIDCYDVSKHVQLGLIIVRAP